MGLVEGQSLAQKVAGGPLPPREAARLVHEITEAVQYAHEHGVIHRDLKPANVLLDGKGRPRVTDFGLAKKVAADSGLTASGQIMGTPGYMPPEQAAGRLDVGPLADVYSVGAILYHLLTGRPPFQAASVMDTLMQVVERDPVPLRQLNPDVPRDLETIALKCLQKDPARRYASAAALASDLDAWLAGRPIAARPVSPPERYWRWCKRNPWLAGANITAAALTMILAIGATVAALVYRDQVRTLEKQRRATERAEKDGRRRTVDALIAQADAGQFSNRPGQRFNSLDAIGEAIKILNTLEPSPATAAQRDRLRDLAIAALALPDVRTQRTVNKLPWRNVNWDVDPTFTRYAATNSTSGNCVVYRLADGLQAIELPNGGPPCDGWPRLGPGGRSLAVWYNDRRLRVWRLEDATATLIVDIPAHKNWEFATFRPGSGAEVAFTFNGRLTLVDLQSGRRRELPRGPGTIGGGEFRPDGERLAVVIQQNGVWKAQIRSLDNAHPEAEFALPAGLSGSRSVTWSPDGRRLALACYNTQILIWEIDRSTTRVLTGSHSGDLRIAFNHRGDLLSSNGWEGVLRLWDPATGRQLLNLGSHAQLVQFSPDDRLLLDEAYGKLLLREVTSPRACRVLAEEAGPEHQPQDIAFGPGDRLLAVQSKSGLALRDLETGEKAADLKLLGSSSLGTATVRFVSDGSMVTGDRPGLLQWPVRRGRGGSTIRLGPPRMLLDARIRDSAFSVTPDGRVVVAAVPHTSYGAIAHVNRTPERTIHLGPQPDVRYVAVSPDGRWAATVTHIGGTAGDVGVGIWEVETGSRVRVLPARNISQPLFSPDGRSFVIANEGCDVCSVGSWRLERTIDTQGRYFAFSPDGRLLALSVEDAVRLYDFASGRRLATLAAQDPSITGRVAFSRDGTRLAVIGLQSHQIHVWDLRRVRAGLAALGLDWDAPPLGSPPPDDAPTPPEPMRLEVAGATPEGLQWAERGFQLRQAAQRLRRLFTPKLSTPYEYADRALDWARLGQPDAAYADLVFPSARAVRDARQDLPLLRQIGEAQARQARWVKAAATYGRIQELGSLDHWDAYRYAVLLPQSGDVDGYRRHRKWILDHFRQTKDVAIARRLSKACLIVPLPGRDQDEAASWAVAAADESIPPRSSRRITRGTRPRAGTRSDADAEARQQRVRSILRRPGYLRLFVPRGRSGTSGRRTSG
jgi:WD40 repeat protein